MPKLNQTVKFTIPHKRPWRRINGAGTYRGKSPVEGFSFIDVEFCSKPEWVGTTQQVRTAYLEPVEVNPSAIS